jgi:hypothetical protein
MHLLPGLMGQRASEDLISITWMTGRDMLVGLPEYGLNLKPGLCTRDDLACHDIDSRQLSASVS